MGELPSDVSFYHILPRLPAKSIMCFKCVSKQWHSFITTREFAKLHLQHMTNNEDHKLIFISNTTPHVFRTLDCEAPDNGLSTRRPLSFDAVYDRIYFIETFNGLVCVGLMNGSYEEYADLVIWNPVTSEYKILSRTNSHRECYEIEGSFELFYISCQDEYKLLRVTKSRDVYIYSLRYDSWTRVESKVFSSYGGPSPAFHDRLYFALNVMTKRKQRHFKLKMIDLNTEKLSSIKTPSLGNTWNVGLSLMFLRGKLHIWKENSGQLLCYKTEVVLWRMDGDGEWTKVFSYYPSQCLVNFDGMYPLYFMRNGNWLVYTKGKVYKVDMTKRTNGEFQIYIPTNMELRGRAKYIETFVSPNQYVEPNPQV